MIRTTKDEMIMSCKVWIQNEKYNLENEIFLGQLKNKVFMYEMCEKYLNEYDTMRSYDETIKLAFETKDEISNECVNFEMYRNFIIEQYNKQLV